jgi:hypothetical protein
MITTAVPCSQVCAFQTGPACLPSWWLTAQAGAQTCLPGWRQQAASGQGHPGSHAMLGTLVGKFDRSSGKQLIR